MTLRRFGFGIFGFVLFFGAFAAPAQAQATRTWVSGVGDDVNPCSRTAPCKTFAGAISKTAAGGEINCIDPGGFGAVTITKAMTIDCANIEAGIVVAGTNGIVVNAGAADVVTLRGLDLMGTLTTPGLNGVVFNTGGALHVEKCLIREFTSAAPNGNGILFQPTGSSKLFVTDTVLTNNANSGVKMRPTGSGGGSATITRTMANGNNSGFAVDTSAPTSSNASMIITDSVSSGNATAGISFISTASSGNAFGMIDRSTSSLNTTGIAASGSRSLSITGGSTIWGNVTAGISLASGGQILSFGNNQMPDVGTFTPPLLALR